MFGFRSTSTATGSLNTGIAVAVTAGLVLFANAAFADDTGDAPQSYGQAAHVVVAGSAFLGDDAPDDNVPQAGLDALGDDNEGIDDEGGVFAFPVLVQNAKSYTVNVFATNPGPSNATLSGWIDFDGNGLFDADEFATASVAPGTDNEKFKLLWPDLTDISTSFNGTTYARFRISTDVLGAGSAQGQVRDGEVEDYSLEVLLDSDGDERPDITDLDNDNDGIPDTIEGTDVDTDGDGLFDYLDTDSDADLIPDYVEAGRNPLNPADTDSDGTPDYLDLDSNQDGTPDSVALSGDADRDGISDVLEGVADTDNDGVLDRNDLDADNDTIPDVIEAGLSLLAPVDTDGDGIADYLDNDSDNDGIPDIHEANTGELDVFELDTDNDGRVDSTAITGSNGLADLAETSVDSGVPVFAVANSDQDGVRDFRDLDSDADGINDLLEVGGNDVDGNGIVDSNQDTNQDGLIDDALLLLSSGMWPDVDDDNIPDFQDNDADGSSGIPGQNPAQVETGLSGGAGCSITGHRASNAASTSIGLLPLLFVFALVALGFRISRPVCSKP